MMKLNSMSVIKDIFQITKEGTIQAHKIRAVKRALRTELKLNAKLLVDIQYGRPISDARRRALIAMLEINELSAAVKYDIPFKLICSKKVNFNLAKQFKIKRIHGFDFEMLVESLYLKIAYLKKDHRNENINLNLRLINIYKYTRILIELLD